MNVYPMIRRWWLPVTLGLCLSFLMGLPSLYYKFFDPTYAGIELLGSDAEEVYVAQIREVYDGYYRLGNPFLIDEKSDPYILQPLSPIIIASLGKVLGLSAVEADVAAKFIFSFLIFLLAFQFFTLILKRKDYAILCALFVSLIPASTALINPQGWFDLVRHGSFINSDYRFLYYARPINPQIGSVVFFAYLICLWKFNFSERRLKVYGVLASILLGLAFYTYFFSYTLMWVFTIVFLLWLVVKKRWVDFRFMLPVVGGAFLVGIPYFINVWRVLHSPEALELAYRLGVVDTRKFVFSRTWWVGLVMILLFYRGSREGKLFIWLFLAATFLVTNQQLLTGRTAPIPSHYHWYYIAPFVSIFVIVSLLTWVERFSSRLSKICLILISGIVFLLSALFQYRSYHTVRPSTISLQRYAGVLSFLNREINGEQVILTDYSLASLVPIYTGHDLYFFGGSTDTLVSAERLRHFFYTYVALQGVSADEAEGYFTTHRDEVGGMIFAQKFRTKNGCYGCFPDSVLADLVDGYKEFVKHNLLENIRRYPISYIVWDQKSSSQWIVPLLFKNPIYDRNDIKVYKMGASSP